MKKFFMISVLMGALPLSMVAQDDLYFVPKKKSAEVVEVTTPVYNRAKSQYEVIQNDSTIDIIEFDGQKGVYPDSIVTEDFELTKRMQRFEDYDLSDNAAFWAGYHLGRDTWNWGLSWHSPWYYTRYGWYGGFYDPWYYGYYDPWYYGYYGWRDPWYYGYYDPFYYGYYGWYDPWRYGYYGYYDLGYPYYTTVYYGGAPRRYSYTGNTGTINRNGRTHGYFAGDRSKASHTYSSSVNSNRSSSLRNRTVGEHRSRINDSSNSSIRNNRSSNSGNFSGSRSTSSYSNSTSSYSNSGSSRSSSSGSFSSGGGGSFSSGGGGGRSGGGSLGGRR